MAEKAPHSRFNPNESWLEGRGSWLTYGVIVCITHLAILSVPFIGRGTAWTLTSIIHCIVSGANTIKRNRGYSIISSVFVPLFV